MVSQWATVLTITANPAVPKLDPNSRAVREAALRAELAEAERVAREAEVAMVVVEPVPGVACVSTFPALPGAAQRA